MGDDQASRTFSRKQRLRAQALWAFVIAAIGLGVTLVGLVQYLVGGTISVRPGVEPLAGEQATAALTILFSVSTSFAAAGWVLKRRANRAAQT